jgi:thiamine monophosphate kinase
VITVGQEDLARGALKTTSYIRIDRAIAVHTSLLQGTGVSLKPKKLAELHTGYESAKEYPKLHRKENKALPLDWRVERMKLTPDKRAIQYNEFLTLEGIPPEVFDYKLGNRSALEWVIDQYEVSTDKQSGIESDPNRPDDEQYIVRLIGQVITVSLETLKIVESLPADFPDEKLQAVQGGIAEACAATGTFVLGGDTNQSSAWQMGGTAFGLIPANEPIISRKGARAGDVLFCSGPMGLGSAYAFEMLLSAEGQAVVPYRPMPRLAEGKWVRQFGSTCIDTSDGFLHALCNLLEVNDIGFNIDIPFTQMAHPEVLRLHKTKQLPAWIFLAGPHGEFELVFTIPQNKEQSFLTEANKMGWNPLRVGTCTQEKGCAIRTKEGAYQPFNPCQIANAYVESGGDPKAFLTQLLKFETQWEIQKMNG